MINLPRLAILAVLFFVSPARAQAQLPEICRAARSLDLVATKAALVAGAPADTNCSFQTGVTWSPLIFAMSQGVNTTNRAGIDQLGELLARSGSSPDFINVRRGTWGRRSSATNFARAISVSLSRTVKAYLSHGANPNAFSNGVSLLTLAASASVDAGEERFATIDALVAAGAEIYSGPQSLLELELTHQFPEPRILARIAIWDFARGKTSLAVALGESISSKQSIRVLRALLERGADLNDATLPLESYGNALQILVATQRLDDASREMFEFILAGTKEMNAKDGLALRLAVQNQPVWVMRRLLEAGANPNVTPSPAAAMPPMLAAVDRIYDRLADDAISRLTLLLDRGAKIDQVDENGRTALRYSVDVCNGTEPVTEFLVARGADPNHRDGLGRTVACAAHVYGCQAAEIFLRAHGGILGHCHP